MTVLDDALLALLAKPPHVSTPVKASPPTAAQLKAILTARGDLDPVTGATARARVTRCTRRCRRTVFLGLFDRGWSVTADVKPLSAGGEAMALLSGWRTYALISRDFTPDNLQLHRRYGSFIAGHPAGDPDLDVVVEHNCDVDRCNELPHIKSVFDRRLIQPLPINPPF